VVVCLFLEDGHGMVILCLVIMNRMIDVHFLVK
jgi:hypothetical protein